MSRPLLCYPCLKTADDVRFSPMAVSLLFGKWSGATGLVKIGAGCTIELPAPIRLPNARFLALAAETFGRDAQYANVDGSLAGVIAVTTRDGMALCEVCMHIPPGHLPR